MKQGDLISTSSIETSYDFRKAIQCIECHPSLPYLLVGTLSDLKLLHYNSSSNSFTEISTYSFSSNLLILDIQWNKVKHSLFSVILSNFEVKFFKFNESNQYNINRTSTSSSTSSQSCLVLETTLDRQSGIQIYKLDWHPNDPNIFCIPQNDGYTCIYKLSEGSKPIRFLVLKGQRVANKDAKFNPTYPEYVADCNEIGYLRLWNLSTPSAPVMVINILRYKINSISWHSTEPWIIAAAGDEKLVKIFNINDKMEVVPTSKTKRSLVGYTSLNSPKINFNEDDFPEYDNLLELYEKKIFTNTLLSSRLVRPTKIHQINLSGEALKIQWCSSSFSFLNSSTLSSFSPSTSTSTSLSPSKAYFNNFLLIQSNTMQNQTYIDIYSPFFSHIPMCSTVGNESIKSATFIVLPKFSKEREENSSGTAIIPKEIKSNNYSYCILTANSYGKLIAYNIQYLKTFYPRICPSLAVVSAQGFLAIHRGSIKKPLEIVNKIFSHNKNKKKMYIKKKMDEKKRSLLKSYDSLLPFVVKNDKNNKEISPSSTATLSENILAKSLGNVWVALPDFRNLEEARDIRLIGSSANASVFDPALISLLARNYSMTHGLKLPKSKLNITQPSSESIDGFKTKEEEENEKKKKEDGGIDGREEEDHYSIYDKPSEENLNKVPNEKQAAALAAAAAADAAAIKIEDPLLFGCDNLTIEEKIAAEFEYQFALYEDAIEACNHNYEVALRAGLKCRASVWATMVSLIPIPSLSNSILNQIKKDLSEDSENKIKNLNKYFFLSLKTSSELSFSIELIGNLLNELLTSGDSQHFVVMREILRRCDLLPLIDQVVSLNIYQIRQMYLAYIDLLQRLKLFNHACEIKANIDDEILANLSRKAIDIYIKCSQCKKDLKIKNLSNRSATVWCSKCKECVSKCCFCLKPINGLLQMCPICSHGGHIECMSYWFAMHSSCPSGCTHECSPEYAQLSSNYLFRNNSLTNPSICSGVSPSNNGQFSNNYFCQPTLIYRRNFYRGARMKQLKARFG